MMNALPLWPAKNMVIFQDKNAVFYLVRASGYTLSLQEEDWAGSFDTRLCIFFCQRMEELGSHHKGEFCQVTRGILLTRFHCREKCISSDVLARPNHLRFLDFYQCSILTVLWDPRNMCGWVVRSCVPGQVVHAVVLVVATFGTSHSIRSFNTFWLPSFLVIAIISCQL